MTGAFREPEELDGSGSGLAGSERLELEVWHLPEVRCVGRHDGQPVPESRRRDLSVRVADGSARPT